MSHPKDDLEAVRVIADALDGFEKHEQERILRWAREKIGLQQLSSSSFLSSVASDSIAASSSVTGQSPTDIRTFLNEKNPGSDVHFAAAVAYYFRFVAPENERKNEIDAELLQEACRKSQRTRLAKASKTLANAHSVGYLDKGAERGTYSINSVGENLVAMTMPLKDGAKRARKTKKSKKKAK